MTTDFNGANPARVACLGSGLYPCALRRGARDHRIGSPIKGHSHTTDDHHREPHQTVNRPLHTDDYDYDLPPELIAHQPAAERTGSRLMVVQGHERQVVPFGEIGSFLRPGDLLVFNDTRVVPCRLVARKPSGGRVEVFILGPAEGLDWSAPASVDGRLRARALTRSSKVLKPQTSLRVEGMEAVEVNLETRLEGGAWEITIGGAASLLDLVEAAGEMPLPPYIVKRRKDLGQDTAQDQDQERYQTVYARHPGAVAAPTAGLHFSQPLLDALVEAGVELGFVTLHVGIGTFRPLAEGPIEDQELHEETYLVSPELAAQVAKTRVRGGRIIAVGTTSTRALEDQGALHDGGLVPGAFSTRIFIKPGHRWTVVDAMVTNFHLPRSSLMVLISALGSHRAIHEAYAEAIDKRMRFYSYGDAMLLFAHNPATTTTAQDHKEGL